jgi:hypothetical protein
MYINSDRVATDEFSELISQKMIEIIDSIFLNLVETLKLSSKEFAGNYVL